MIILIRIQPISGIHLLCMIVANTIIYKRCIPEMRCMRIVVTYRMAVRWWPETVWETCLFKVLASTCKDLKTNFLFTTAPFFFLHQLFRQLSFFIWDGHYILCKKLIPVKFWLKNFQKILSMIVFRTNRFWVNRIVCNTKQNDQCDSRREVGMAWAFWRGNLWNCQSIQLEFGWNIIWSLIIFIKSL